jgi:hypothetical protein
MMPAHVHVVKVTINGKTISVDKDRVTVHQDSFVQWSGNEAFSITFQDPGPFGARLNHADAQKPHGPNKGFTGSYKYTVTSDRDSTIELDPFVIVDPGLTGTH